MTSCALMERTKAGPLLPRLRLLTWNVGHMSSASLPLFLSPTLRKISLELTRVSFHSSRRGRESRRICNGIGLAHHSLPSTQHRRHAAAWSQPNIIPPLTRSHCSATYGSWQRVIHHSLRSIQRFQDLKGLDVEVPGRSPDSMASSPVVAGITTCNKL